MHNKPLLIASLATASLFITGCVGVGPNTQQGAVTGGALGAVAGAIIGHNSAGTDALGGAILGATAGAIAGGTIGNSVDHQQGTLYDNSRPYGYNSTGYRYARQVPPPPASTPADVIPAPPVPNAVWVPGYWSYAGTGYQWVAGRWEVPPPNASSYVAAHWERRGDGYVYVAGAWH